MIIKVIILEHDPVGSGITWQDGVEIAHDLPARPNHFVAHHQTILAPFGYEVIALPPNIETIVNYHSENTVFILKIWGDQDPMLELVKEGSNMGARIIVVCSGFFLEVILAALPLGAVFAYVYVRDLEKLIEWLKTH